MSQPARLPQALLRVRNLRVSLHFYREVLGFGLRGERPEQAVLLAPDNAELVLQAGAAPAEDRWPGVPISAPGAWVYLQRPDLTELASLLSLRLGSADPVAVEHPYPGYRHLQVPDPDGYLLTFWESLPLEDPEVLEMFRAGPDRLRRAVAGLDEAALDLPRAPGKWSLRQIVHHLVDSDLSTFQVIRLGLALPGPEIHADLWTPDEWMEGLDCAHRPIGPAVELFTAARSWICEVVAHLPGALDRSVTWPSGYRAQVRDLLRQVGGHALHHILQVEAVRQRYGRA